MAMNWEKIDSTWYYFIPNGVLATYGWIGNNSGEAWSIYPADYNTKWYFVGYAARDGRMNTGWVKYNNRYYYMNHPNGEMAVGWIK